MKKTLNILFVHDDNDDSHPNLIIDGKDIIFKINTNSSIYHLKKNIKKIKQLIVLYEDIEKINLILDDKIIYSTTLNLTNIIITMTSDIFYEYGVPMTINLLEGSKDNEGKRYKLVDNNDNNSQNKSNLWMQELNKYKSIVMDPNKNPSTYLKYVTDNIPSKYKLDVQVVTGDNFPLINAVRMGSTHNAYFVHISPENIDPKKKNILLIGKAVTYDSGGLNIKTRTMETMKVDMTGSAIILSVLRLLKEHNHDNNLNIHLFIPIVENMIGNNGTKPGSVVKTKNSKTVEIIDIDAEGRLCLADCFEWINMHLLKSNIYSAKNTIIIDVATLTGSAGYITAGISSILMSNNIAQSHADKLMQVGESVGEYLDYLKIRREYLTMLKSPVADIGNISKDPQGGCITAGAFLEYFINKNIPWLHIDLGNTTFKNLVARSHGINLLYEFIKQYN